MSERTTPRLERVSETIKEEISLMLETEQVKDPRIGFVTITRCTVSPDLSQAKVYFSLIGGPKKREQTLAGLNSAKGFLRTELGKRLHLKKVPEISFVFDESVQASARIARILKKLKEEEVEK